MLVMFRPDGEQVNLYTQPIRRYDETTRRERAKVYKRIRACVIAIALLLTAPCRGDSLMSVPETHTERWYIAYFCDASLAASLTDAQLAAVGAWIAKFKPDIDCARERQPSLVSSDGDKKK